MEDNAHRCASFYEIAVGVEFGECLGRGRKCGSDFDCECVVVVVIVLLLLLLFGIIVVVPPCSRRDGFNC